MWQIYRLDDKTYIGAPHAVKEDAEQELYDRGWEDENHPHKLSSGAYVVAYVVF